MSRWLVVLLCSLVAVSCNRARSGADERAEPSADAATDAAEDAAAGDTSTRDARGDGVELDTGADAPLEDAEPDAPVMVDVDGDDIAPEDVAPEDVAPEDVAPEDVAPEDATPDSATWLAWVVEQGASREVLVAPFDAPEDSVVVHRSIGNLSYLRFQPATGLLFFLETDASDDTQIVRLDWERSELQYVRPPELDGEEFQRIVALNVLSDGSLAITANTNTDAALRLFFLNSETGAFAYGTFPPDGAQHREAASSSRGFGLLYLEFAPPGPGDLWFDGMGGAAPMQLTEGVPVVADISAWPGDEEGGVFFTNEDRNLCVVSTTPFDPIAPPFASYSVLTGVEEFHPRPTPDGCCVVTSRYPPEVSVRPTPRDLFVVDVRTGETVRRLTSSALASERWPDVYQRAPFER